MSPLRWAIVGTGFISNTVVQAINDSPGSVIAAVGGRTSASVKDFAERHGIDRHTTDVDALVTSSDVDVVYVGTPNHAHHPVVIPALRSGTPCLSEKSLTRSMISAHQLVDAARETETLFVEGLMYLAHPMYVAVVELLKSGDLGTLRSVTGWYHADIVSLANAAGGGTLFNLGCYPVSLLQLIVQAMCGDAVFADREIAAVGTRATIDAHEIVVDAAVSVRFGNGVIASLQSSDTHGMDHGFVVVTDRGTLRWKTNPWLPEAGDNVVAWEPHGETADDIVIHSDHDSFLHQVQMMEQLIASGRTEADRPLPRLSDSLEIMAFLTEWEVAI